MTIHVIGCGKTKRSLPCPIEDLYIGNPFKAHRVIHEVYYPQYPAYVISAKLGLVEFGTVVKPYDLHIGDLNEAQLEALKVDVRRTLRKLGVTKILASYPSTYRVIFEGIKGVKVEVPYPIRSTYIYVRAKQARDSRYLPII